MSYRLFFQTIFSLIILASCKQLNVYEYNTTIPDYSWQKKFKVNGSFNISDTAAAYNIYIVLRHTDGFKYNNIWLNAGLGRDGDSLFRQKLNVNLGDDANGWEGSGMNDIWEVRKLLNGEPRKFIHAGVYRFSIEHIMRDNPLKGIISAGLRVEKTD